MKLKQSRYNQLVEYSGERWGFQGRTGALAQIDESTWNLLAADRVEEGDGATADLVRAGFLVPEDIDELTMLRHESYAARYGTDALELVIAPTLNCNLRCTYCFEGGVKRIDMDDRVAAGVVDFVKRQAVRARTMRVVWYGGEPLLALNRIRQMTHALLAIGRGQLGYEAMMITNGTRLTPDVAAELKSLKIGRVQVTVDGDPDSHDAARCKPDGGGTWHTIMDNVVHASRQLEVVVRATLRPDAMAGLYALCQELDRRNLPPTTRVTAAPLNEGGKCTDGGCRTQLQFTRALFDQVLNSGYLHPRLNLPYPEPRPGGCLATRLHAYLIDPHGDVHNCFETAGQRDRAIGSLLDEMGRSEHQRWLQTDPFLSDGGCLDCDWLPGCQGGCPNALLQSGSRECTGMKDSTDLWIAVQSMLASGTAQ